MSKIIDLSLLVQEPLIFKDKKGVVYTIPGEISTSFVTKMSYYQEKISAIKSEVEAFDELQSLAMFILNLDKTKIVDMEYIKENFDDVRVLKLIVTSMMDHIKEISKDPN
jgi:hypothetical protein